MAEPSVDAASLPVTAASAATATAGAQTAGAQTAAAGPPGPARRSKSRIAGRQGVAGWLFASPALVGLALFFVAPILLAMWVSFRDWSGLTPLRESTSVGAGNYQDLLARAGVVRGDFAKSLRNNLYYVLGVVPAQTALAFLLAVIVNGRFLKGRTFFRTAFYFPSVTSSIAVAFIFVFLFSPAGVVNTVLSVLLPGKVDTVWLDDSDGLIHLVLR
jgi:multiple sugar transport system permease protein